MTRTRTRTLTYGALHHLSQTHDSLSNYLPGALGFVQIRRPRRGRPAVWRRVYAPISDAVLHQLYTNRSAIEALGRRATNEEAFERALKQTRPDWSGHRRRAHAKVLARRVPDFRKYARQL